MDHLNALDWVILGILIVGFINGFRKGLIMELATLAGLFLGIWLAIKGHFKMEELIRGNSSFDGPWLPYLSFVLVFIGVYIICYIGGKALSAAVSLLMLGIFNKIAGGLFGMLKLMMFSSILFMMINNAGWSFLSNDLEKGSSMFNSVKSTSAFFYPAVDAVLPDNRPNFIDKLLGE
jgi:membrane protein required for colicin V production